MKTATLPALRAHPEVREADHCISAEEVLAGLGKMLQVAKTKHPAAK